VIAVDRAVKVLKDVMEIYEEIAEDYVAKRRKPWSPLLSRLDTLPTPSLILDAGSGGGRHALPLANRGMEVVCLDFSKALLNTAKQLVKRATVHLVRGDLRCLPFKHNSFNAVVNIAALHHLPTSRLRLEALQEALRTLRKEGLLLVSVWSRRQLRFFWPLIKGFFAKLRGRLFEYGDVEVPWRYRGEVYLRFYHLFTCSELRKLIEQAGFKMVEVYGFSLKSKLLPQNYVAIAVKPAG